MPHLSLLDPNNWAIERRVETGANCVKPSSAKRPGKEGIGMKCLTISVHPPRRDASQGARTQTRRINLVGLNRRPEDGRVGDKGVCKVCARVHAQIMTGDLPRVLICAIGFASIAGPHECVARPRATHPHILDPRLCRPQQSAVTCRTNIILPDIQLGKCIVSIPIDLVYACPALPCQCLPASEVN